MNNLSFKAKLIIDKNVYEKLQINKPDGYVNKLFDEYKKFLNIKSIEKVTKDDTIHISMGKTTRDKRFTINMKFLYNNESKNEISEVESSNNDNYFRPYDFIRETMVFIMIKLNKFPRLIEPTKKGFIRIMKEYIEENKE